MGTFCESGEEKSKVGGCPVIDIREIKERLANRAGEVAAYLYPNGKRVHDEWCIGGIDGMVGKSMKVNLNGKSGTWSDFATGEGGDLIDLWCAAKGMTLKAALPDIKDYLGIKETKFEAPKKAYHRPAKPKCSKPKNDVLEYLHGRGLSDEAIAVYKISAAGRDIIFPYLWGNELIFAKRRSIDLKDGKKVIMPIAAGMEACLFGWQAIPDSAREVVIVEGELDAPSLWMLGYPALSVPFGGGGGNKQAWVANEWDNLEQFETIYLCMDSDSAGQEATEELIERLGRYRCMVVTLPKKDANECLTSGVEKEEIAKCFENAKSISPDTLRDVSTFKDEVLDEFFPPEGTSAGIDTPWPQLSENFVFRRSEVTALAGINSHGKSQVAGQIAIASIAQDEPVCIASLEMRPRKVLRRIVKQATNQGHPTREYIAAAFDWMAEKLYMFDVLGMAKVPDMLEAFEYARRRYGVRMFIIDNFTKCGIAEDDHTGQKNFIDMITDFANKYDCHVIVLFHPRKMENEAKAPGKMDVRGSGALTDLVHNSLTIWRNKAKEQKLKSLEIKLTQGEEVGAEIAELQRKSDSFLICDKQREGDWEGRVGLWFNQDSYQFRDYTSQFNPYFKFSSRGSSYAFDD